jgi:hypothetical protein
MANFTIDEDPFVPCDRSRGTITIHRGILVPLKRTMTLPPMRHLLIPALLLAACQSSPDTGGTDAAQAPGTRASTAVNGPAAEDARNGGDNAHADHASAGGMTQHTGSGGGAAGSTTEQDVQLARKHYERDAWQRPEELFAMMDNDVQGLVIADLFADDGYFTWKFLERGAIVIAVETDPAKVEFLKQEKKRRGYNDDQLRIRLAREGDPALGVEEAQVVLITHRYTTIKNRGAYFKRVREGLSHPRATFIIDWQYADTPMGPPLSQRMKMEDVMDELGSFGYTDIGAHSKKMPDQVIFFATDPMDED